jgi:hypothetical protein
LRERKEEEMSVGKRRRYDYETILFCGSSIRKEISKFTIIEYTFSVSSSSSSSSLVAAVPLKIRRRRRRNTKRSDRINHP